MHIAICDDNIADRKHWNDYSTGNPTGARAPQAYSSVTPTGTAST